MEAHTVYTLAWSAEAKMILYFFLAFIVGVLVGRWGKP